MKEDIKETKEMLDALELIVLSCVKIMKDGKIRIDDLKIFFDLLKDIDKIKDGFVGIKEIPKEVKDIDEQELIEIGLAVYKIVEKVKEELEKPSDN